MAHTSWMKRVEDETNPREKLRKAREAVAECMDAGFDGPYLNTASAQHSMYSEDVLACREIIDQLGPQFDPPPPDPRPRFIEFVQDPRFKDIHLKKR
jgi:hypothetical protein